MTLILKNENNLIDGPALTVSNVIFYIFLFSASRGSVAMAIHWLPRYTCVKTGGTAVGTVCERQCG